jgi:hypothetical protein
MTMTIELNSEEEIRLAAAARQEGLAPAELARRLVVEHLASDAVMAKGQYSADASAQQEIDPDPARSGGENVLDWDAWTSTPPPQVRLRSGEAPVRRPRPTDAC